MRSSWRLARNNLAGRRGRAALMVGAIALASALVTAVACAIGAVQVNFEYQVAKLLGATDVRVFHQFGGKFEPTVLEQVSAWPEVELASGRMQTSITLRRTRPRERDSDEGTPRSTVRATGLEFDRAEAFRPLPLAAGVFPNRADEILLDPLAAQQLNARPGDRLEVQRFGDPIELTVAGIYERKLLGTLQRPRVRMDRTTLAAAANQADELSYILVILKAGVDPEEFCAAYVDALPAELALEPAELVASGFYERLEAGKLSFLLAVVVTFVCASFIIVTGLTAGVTEKQRELAIVRCVGGSRGQLVAGQLLTGVVLATLGAAIGAPLGVGLAWTLVQQYAEFLPAGMAIPWSGVGLAFGGAIGSGLLGAAYPAFLASRTAPLQAMAATGRPTSVRAVVIAALIGGGLIAGQWAVTSVDDPQLRFWLHVYIGLVMGLIGYFVIAAPAFALLARGLGPPLSWLLRLPSGMLTRSMLTSPFRHGLTAGAMMVGVTIMISTWTNANTITDQYLEKMKFPDGFAFRANGLTPQEQQAIADLPFVEDVCMIAWTPLGVTNRHMFGVEGLASPSVAAIGFDPDKFFSMNSVEWAAGDPAEVIRKLKRGEGIVVAKEFLTQGVGVGDTLRLGAGRVEHDFEIAGVIDASWVAVIVQSFGIRSAYLQHAHSCVFMDLQTAKDRFGNDEALFLQINMSETISDDDAKEAVTDVAPGVVFHSGRWIRQRIDEVVGVLISINAGVAFAALLLACLGVGNVILANIESRRYEFGVLRATGGGRFTVARLIFAEALVIGLTAALVGTLNGLQQAYVAAIHYRDIAGIPFDHLNPPIGPSVLSWAVVIGMALLAAGPAVRAIVAKSPRELVSLGRNG